MAAEVGPVTPGDRPLSAKRRRFVAEFVIDCNGTQAAIRAGYSRRTANEQAVELLKDPRVKAALAVTQTAHLRQADLSAAAVLEAIRRQVHGDVRTLFDARGNLRPIHSLSAEDASLIAGFEVIIKNAAAGDGHTDTIHKVKLKDASRYVEMAAKHFALLTDVVRVTTDEALLERLTAGRAHAAVAVLETPRRET